MRGGEISHMADADHRIGHFVEAQILEALGVDDLGTTDLTGAKL